MELTDYTLVVLKSESIRTETNTIENIIHHSAPALLAVVDDQERLLAENMVIVSALLVLPSLDRL